MRRVATSSQVPDKTQILHEPRATGIGCFNTDFPSLGTMLMTNWRTSSADICIEVECQRKDKKSDQSTGVKGQRPRRQLTDWKLWNTR
uniref:Uncharacterized protein n=1 Tax=Romanomermis culicivorax TaxID=13658 RepID=A0A915LE91_ROMCU